MGFTKQQVEQWKANAARASGKPVDELAILAAPSKYRSKRVEVNGVKYDSKKEATRHGMLLLKEKIGAITDLKRQVPYDLGVCKYIADHQYIENGTLIVEDVKSKFTRKLPVYSIKRKLMKQLFGITIREV